ncbi:MAG: response regulator transcription factor [Desulfosarcinaceae bacterium]
MKDRPTILIIEPNAHFRKALVNVIRSSFSGLSIIECGTAEDAMRKSIVLKPRLVLMDIHLSDASGPGLNLIRDIARRSPTSRIAVLTDSDADEYQQAAFQNGAKFFISKTEPDESIKVLAMIRETLPEA